MEEKAKVGEKEMPKDDGGEHLAIEGEEEEEATKIERLKAAMKEQLARFRPPFTPSNSLLLQQSPPAIKVTRPLQSCKEGGDHHPKESEEIELSQKEQGHQTESIMPRQHQPQPFPLPLRRRSSSTASNPHSPGQHHPFPSNRHSMPRLSITSLGSVAKTFQTLAAFIVPEEQSDRERERELRRANQRRASLAALAKVQNNNVGKKKNMKEEDEEDLKRRKRKQIAEKGRGERQRRAAELMNSAPNSSTIMRSSSAKPIPRSAINTPAGWPSQGNRPIPFPRQKNGGTTTTIGGRDASRSKSAAGNQQNGGMRAPSVPATPRIVNKKYAHIKSKVNSITDHSATPSSVKIFHEPLKVNATPRVGSLQNANHVPAGGNVKIENRKLNFRESAKPKVEAKTEIQIPKSDKKILTQKLVWKAEPKVGSLNNAAYKPGGGQIKIFNEAVKVKAESKVVSLDNIGHVPGGGNVKISDYSRSISGNGSVRSRRDTPDSGRSSSLASGGGEQRQNIDKTSEQKLHNCDEENNMMGESHHEQQQPELEMIITPRNLESEFMVGNHQQQENHQNEVAEEQLINFG